MTELFTEHARMAMILANKEAKRFDQEYVCTEHILLGIVKEGSGRGAKVLKALGVDLVKVTMEVAKLHPIGAETRIEGDLPLTPGAKKVLEYTFEEARKLNNNCVGTEHLLLGILRDDDGTAAEILQNVGIHPQDVRNEVRRSLVRE